MKIVGKIIISCICISLLGSTLSFAQELPEVVVTAQAPSPKPIQGVDAPEAKKPNAEEINKELQNMVNNQKKKGSASSVGINMNTECMQGAGCSFSIYDALGIKEKTRAEGQETNIMTTVQDVILGATFFIGTVVTVALIVCGLLFIFSGTNPALQGKAKKGMINAFIGLIIVSTSYVIIRLIQYLISARG